MEPKAKTKIWHGGLQALLAGGEGAPDVEHAPAPAAKRGATQIMPEPLSKRGATQIGSAPFAVQAAVVTPSSWQAVTRVLPIEQVFPQPPAAIASAAVQAAASSAGASPATATDAASSESESTPLDVPASWPELTLGGRLRAKLAALGAPAHGSGLAARVRAIGAKVGRERLILYGCMLGVVAALLLLHVARGAVAEAGEQPQLARPTGPAATEPPIPRTAKDAVASTAPTTSSAPAGTVSQGVERAAADALARGDYAAAHRIYTELAKTTPEPSPYSEAARILSAQR